jgi:hypothetical protein
MKQQISHIVLGIFLGNIKYTEGLTQLNLPANDEFVATESLATQGRRHHNRHKHHHNNMHSRDNGHYQHLSQGPLEKENENPFIIFGPPTPEGKTPGGAMYKSAMNATPPANITH